MSAKLGFEGGWFENRVFSSSLLFSELFPVSLRIVASLTAGGAGGEDFKEKWRKGQNSASLLKQPGNSSRKVIVSQSFGLICSIRDSSQVQETSMPNPFTFWVNPPPVRREGPEVCLPKEKAHAV